MKEIIQNIKHKLHFGFLIEADKLD